MGRMMHRGGYQEGSGTLLNCRSRGVVAPDLLYKRSRFLHLHYQNTVMGEDFPLIHQSPTDDPVLLLSEWCAEQNASHSQSRRIVALLSLPHMLSLPLPPRTARTAGVVEFHWHRFLFCPHVQSILRWTSRRSEGASDEFSCMLFPDPNIVIDDGEDVRAGMIGGGEQGLGSLTGSATSAEAAEGVCAAERSATGSGHGVDATGRAGREPRAVNRFCAISLYSPHPCHRERASDWKPRAERGENLIFFSEIHMRFFPAFRLFELRILFLGSLLESAPALRMSPDLVSELKPTQPT
jgi:hypothetical protein